MDEFMTKAGLKLFSQHLQQYEPVDTVYENYTDAKGKQRRRRRELPPGLSKRDEKILKSVQRRAHYLDKGFRVCGLRFGWTFIIGIIPGAGDAADAFLNYYLVVRKARTAELPAWLVQRMLMNNAVSLGIGLVPIVGDVALATWKANSRNAALLEEYLRIRGAEFLKAESKRKESQAVVKPGAGLQEGEKVVGDDGKLKTKSGTIVGGLGWFGSKKKNQQVPASAADSDAVASTSGTRMAAIGTASTAKPAPDSLETGATTQGNFLEHINTPPTENPPVVEASKSSRMLL